MAYPNSTCATGGECKVGDIGPGGGIVIYAHPNLQSWGRYIEAAPKGWFKNRLDPQQDPFCPERPSMLLESDYLIDTSSAIGKGLSNSVALTAICPTGATAIAMEFEKNGYRDWFLPSMNEMNEMFYTKSVGLEGNWYWTSTTTRYNQVTSLLADTGFFSGSMGKANGWKIRPVRYFATATDKAAAKAAADKAAADKAAADKAAADKAAADKAAADKAAADKAAADKAAADKAAADKAAADAKITQAADQKFAQLKQSCLQHNIEVEQLFAKLVQLKSSYPSEFKSYFEKTLILKAGYDIFYLRNVIFKSYLVMDCNQTTDYNDFRMEYWSSDLEKDKQTLARHQQAITSTKSTTITCIKGKVTKKVTAVKPKCPSGYKVKK
jgi:hypothetical protein